MRKILFSIIILPAIGEIDSGFNPLDFEFKPDGTVSFQVKSDIGWPMWWMIQLTNLLPGQEIKILPKGNKAKLPVVSEDGISWKHFDVNKPVRINSSYAIFSWYVPYLLSNIKSLIEQHRGKIYYEELCKTEELRPVYLLKTGLPEEKNAPVIWIQARQHAWEAGSSWTVHGIIEWLLKGDSTARKLCENVTLIFIPIMDPDCVEKGQGGKDRKPHDHNRDWTEKPIWNSVKASQLKLKDLIEKNRLLLFFDLHCPGWEGKGFEWWISSINYLPEATRTATKLLADIFKNECTNSYPFKGFKETGFAYGGGRTARAWVGKISSEKVVSGTLEIPISPPERFNLPPPYQHIQLGKDIGRSIEKWLSILKKENIDYNFLSHE